MKVCRSGFMRWRIRDGPCGSHHEEARAEKCDISASETDEVGDAWVSLLWCGGGGGGEGLCGCGCGGCVLAVE